MTNEGSEVIAGGLLDEFDDGTVAVVTAQPKDVVPRLLDEAVMLAMQADGGGAVMGARGPYCHHRWGSRRLEVWL